MKYKVGDKVKIRSDLKTDKWYGNDTFVNDMEYFKGKVLTIEKINKIGYNVKENNSAVKYNFTDEMIERKVNTMKATLIVKGKEIEVEIEEEELEKLKMKYNEEDAVRANKLIDDLMCSIYFDSEKTAKLALKTFRDELLWYYEEYKDSL